MGLDLVHRTHQDVREPRESLQRTFSFPTGFNVINSDRVCEWVSTAVFPVSVVIDTI